MATQLSASSALLASGNTIPSAPRSSASLTIPSSRLFTRTNGEHFVPAVAAVIA